MAIILHSRHRIIIVIVDEKHCESALEQKKEYFQLKIQKSRENINLMDDKKDTQALRRIV